ncbi:hypothetical protein CPB86DRAFT_709526, partial [Serendipita vermifera]
HSSSQSTISIITPLPYDILRPIFDLLDTETLLNLTLTSRHLNEPASRSLYRHINVAPDKEKPSTRNKAFRYRFTTPHNGKIPFAAFERRPHLREAVQKVCIFSPGKH